MSGIAVAIRMDAAGPDDEALERLARAMIEVLIGPSDGAASRGAEGATLAHAFWATTPEDAARGTHVARRGPFTMVADVRIDNRDDLLPALGVERDIPDPELLLAAWERWGDETIARVVGDFAFAVRDDRTREVVLGRDALGVRPLYFARRRGLVVAASELQALVTSPEHGIDIELDRVEASRLMLYRYGDAPRTLVRDVEAVQPGGLVRIVGATLTRRRIWRPDPFAQSPTTDPDACAELFLEVLTRAVRARLRRTGGLAVLVSGGLDSSGSACLAHELEGDRNMRLLHTSFPGMSCDEPEFYGPIVEKTGAIDVSIDPRNHVELTAPLAASTPPGEMYDATSAMFFPLLETLRSAPKTVVLTGAGGDDLLHETRCEARDHLRAGRLMRAWSSALRGATRSGAPLRYAAGELSQLLVPTRVRSMARRVRPARYVWPSWLTPGAVGDIDAWHRDHMRAAEALRGPTEAQRRLAYRFDGGSDLYFYLARTDFFGRRFGVDQRHPFYDRRVVETLLAMDHDRRFDGVRGKPVLRRALSGILPDVVRDRSFSADFNPYIIDRMVGPHRAQHVEILRHSEVERAGVVREGALLRMFTDVPSNFGEITRAVAIETAIRTLRYARASNDKRARILWHEGGEHDRLRPDTPHGRREAS